MSQIISFALYTVLFIKFLFFCVGSSKILIKLIAYTFLVMNSLPKVFGFLLKSLQFGIKHCALELILNKTISVLNHQALNILVVGKPDKRT